MPDGVTTILNSSFKYPNVIVTTDGNASFNIPELIQQVLSSHTEDFKVHLILTCLHVKDLKVNPESIVVYDFCRNKLDSLELVLEKLKSSVNSTTKNVFVLDNLALFNVQTVARDVKKSLHFFRVVQKLMQKMYIFTAHRALTSEDMSAMFDFADAITHIQLSSSQSTIKKEFVCDLLKMRRENHGGVRHVRTTFEMIDGTIKEQYSTDSSRKSPKTTNPAEMLRNLTTFKLTLEDDEKETKDRLYLPYFEAQKTAVVETEEDYFDDEEEDEI